MQSKLVHFLTISVVLYGLIKTALVTRVKTIIAGTKGESAGEGDFNHSKHVP